MSQCLRCGKPCDATAEFCDDCRSLLRASFREEPTLHVFQGTDTGTSGPKQSSSGALATLKDVREDEAQDHITRQKTRAQSVVQTPITPHPPVLESYPDSAAKAMSRLNEAAQRIAEVEPSHNRRLRRASRLAPFRDISSEITRASTPLPKYTTPPGGRVSESLETPFDEQNRQAQIPLSEDGMAGRAASWPDLWPWFDNEDEGKDGEDTWAGRTDPLITRHKPNSTEAARIEEEDILRAQSEGIPTSQHPVGIAFAKKRTLRMVFVALALFAVLALAVDGILLSVVFVHPHSVTSAANSVSAPSLKLTTNIVFVKAKTQTVQLQILNFARNTSVLLTHDIQENVQISSGQALVPINSSGTATVMVEVTPDWGPRLPPDRRGRYSDAQHRQR